MQQHKLIEDYLEKALPKNISKKQSQNLRQELLCHMLDKVDFYIEIGYDEEAATKKAVEEMGDAEPVCAEFKKIYKAMPHIFFILSVVFLSVSVIFYFITAAILISAMEFYELFLLLLSGEISLLLAIVFAFSCALSYFRVTFEKKLRKAVTLITGGIFLFAALSALWGFVDLYDWYSPVEEGSIAKEDVVHLFPYHNITDEKEEYPVLTVYHVPGTDLIEISAFGNLTTDCSIDYNTRYFESYSLFLNKKFAFEILYGEEMIYRSSIPVSAGKKEKIDGISYTPYIAEDFYAIMISGAFHTYFISASDVAQYNLSFEDFSKTAVEQYKHTRKAVEDKVFLDIPLKQQLEYAFYYFS